MGYRKRGPKPKHLLLQVIIFILDESTENVGISQSLSASFTP